MTLILAPRPVAGGYQLTQGELADLAALLEAHGYTLTARLGGVIQARCVDHGKVAAIVMSPSGEIGLIGHPTAVAGARTLLERLGGARWQ